MKQVMLAVMAGLVGANPALACTFCGDGWRGRQTLRTHYAQSPVVLHGRLSNPKFDPATDGGTTDFRVDAVLKTDPALGGGRALILPRYWPVDNATPPDALIFGSVRGGQLDIGHGVPATAAAVVYLAGVAKLDPADAAKRLPFYFRHRDAADPAVAADASAELAGAADADIVAAAPHFDAAKLRAWIAAPGTPADRLGVYAFALGACGHPADAALLGGLLQPRPLPPQVSTALGGLLAGYVLLAPKAGWGEVAAVIDDQRRPYAERLAAVGTVRFFRASRPVESQANVLACCRLILAHGDLACVAVEDLRQWGWWDVTADVLAPFDKTTHAAPVTRRAIMRYALSCPTKEAKAFVAAARRTDPKLVAAVEESLALYETIPAPPKR